MNSSNDKEIRPPDRHEPLKTAITDNIASDEARLTVLAGDRGDKATDREASATANTSDEASGERVQAQPSSREDAEFRSSSEELIKRLLNLPTPRMDVKVVSVLSVEGKLSRDTIQQFSTH